MGRTKKKPAKPYPDFPLFPHATGRWAKKIRGKFCYFGPWDDPDGALQKFLDQRDDLYAGRKPRIQTDGQTVRDLANRFLTNRRDRVDAGELTFRAFQSYHVACGRVVGAFGDRLAVDLDAGDFAELRKELATTHGPASLALDIRQIRTLFKWAHESGLLETPIRFGPDFRAPGEAAIRKARNGSKRMWEANEIRRLLDIAAMPLRPMILLGINCGFGNSDCGRLPIKALDLEGGWVDFARPKTGIQRRCPLWPETVEALQGAITTRPKPKDEAAAELVFLTRAGTAFAKDRTQDPISRKFRELLNKAGLREPGLGFYGLRHSFETIGGDSRDQVAVNHIMGHADRTMASVYRERIGDERLRAVTDHVRSWLFGEDIDINEADE